MNENIPKVSATSPNSRLAINTSEENNKDLTAEKTCKICGDRAVGFNFGIITCESCKAFFRRNASKEDEIKCPFSNACEINKVSRRFCQSCRLQKCIKMGMKKEWLTSEKPQRLRSPKHKMKDLNEVFDLNEIEKCGMMNEDEVRVPKHMFEKLIKTAQQNSQMLEKPNKCTCKCQCGFYPPETDLVAASPPPALSNPDTPGSSKSITHGFSQMTLPEQRMPAESFFQGIPNHQPPPFNMMAPPTFPQNLCNPWYMNTDTTSTLQEYMTKLSTPSYINPPTQNAFCSYDPLQLGAATTVPPMPDYSRNIAAPPNRVTTIPEIIHPIPAALSHYDRILMQELVDANRVLKAPMNVVAFNDPSDAEIGFLDVVRITDLAMRRIISMVKMLSFFSEQTQSDKIAILKGSLSELLILRGVMVFDPVRDVWRHDIFQGTKEILLNFDILKKTPEQKHYAEHKKFLLSFDDKWRRNENVMLILNAITLFCPDRPNIKDVTKVQSCQRRYYDLLQRYLETQCSETESRQAYDSLLRKLVDLHELNQSLLRIYNQVNPKDLDPLLKELFDIYPLSK